MTSPTPAAREAFVIRRNDYDKARTRFPRLPEPTLSVSVVMPAYREQAKLDLALAALAAQSYPSDLMEVVIADDGSEPPLRLPELRPERTRMVRTPEGQWGIASTVNAGIRASKGEVIVRLDSDVIPERGHVEAHLRWHHVADYFTVVGKLAFVDISVDSLQPLNVRDAVAAGDARSLFDGVDFDEDWQIGLIREAGGRIDNEERAFSTANGATISFTRAMYEACGGLDASMPLGSDTEFGYRMAQEGAVFVPEAEAEAWHLGLSQMKSSKQKEGTRYRHQYMANRVPSLRYLRGRPGLNWSVPFVEVVVDADLARLEEVRATLMSVLGSSVQDVRVVLLGPWESLSAERVRPLEDPQLELRLIREAFSGDPRVVYREQFDRTVEPVPFRFELRAGASLDFEGLQRILTHVDKARLGKMRFLRDDGTEFGVLERTAAVRRAQRLGLGDSTEALDLVWGAVAEPASKWFRFGPDLERSLKRERLERERQLEAERAREKQRTARGGAAARPPEPAGPLRRRARSVRRLAGRVRRGLGWRVRRVLPRR